MKAVSTSLVVFAGLLATPVAPLCMQPQNQSDDDPRVGMLQEFFESKDCPAQRYVADFIEAADRHALDWRLLPSIAYVESGGGKSYRNNNILGWANGTQRFSSVRQGIHAVAEHLATSKLYRDKNIDGILRTFNPEHADYAARVKSVMYRIARQQLVQRAFN